MSTHPEVLWAQRSSESEEDKVRVLYLDLTLCTVFLIGLLFFRLGATQNIVYLTVNLTEINESSLKIDIQPKEITFEAKAGRSVVFWARLRAYRLTD